MFQPNAGSSDRYYSSESPHTSIQKIANLIPENSKVLDVACCTGFLARMIKNKKCEVIGIEVDEAAGKEATKFCDNVIIADVENIETLPYPAGYFDVIVYADILEHLKRPDTVLKRLKPYLKKQGLCIVSLPNIARIEIRLGLLFGKFSYTEIGTMDKTHIRFFTCETAKQLIISEGYSVKQVQYTGAASKNCILKLIPNLFAYQFIFISNP